MDWLKSKTTIVSVCFLALVGIESYALVSVRQSMEEHINSTANELRSMYESTDAKLTSLASDVDVVSKKMGITADELEESQKAATVLKRENAQLTRRLHQELSTKADSETVLKLHNEATNKLNAVQQETNAKIDTVSGAVHGVRTDLDSTRSDLNATREDLANSKRDLGTLIARNSTELAELRRRGERDYVEFDIRKANEYKRVGDVLVQLRKTDAKRQKYEVAINADDSAIIKKDRTANEPITFLVGRDRLRYELVVNFVDKDRIRGYLSAPKDKLAAADNLSLRLR
jgi:chromosome segregation ATPase